MDGDAPEISDIEAVRQQLRTVLRDVNELVTGVEAHGLPDGTHALATALRQRLDDLIGAIDGILTPSPGTTRHIAAVGTIPAPVEEGVLTTLLDDLRDPSRVSYLVQLFLTELHSRRSALMASADSVDVAAAKSAAHTLRSSALLLGATPLGRACEALAANEQPSQLRRLVDDVLTQATAAARWFQIWLSQQPVTPGR
jgi:HPt (histidine-containing phosphotransfer) domain-containing protein